MADEHPPIEAAGAFELRDLLFALYWYVFRARAWILLLVTFMAADALGVFVAGTLGEIRRGAAVRLDGSGPLGIVLLVLLLIAARVQLRLRRQRLRGDIRFSFSGSGLASASPESSSQTAWRAFSRAVELKRAFLLVMASGQLVVLPRRFLAPEQVPAFRQLLGEHLPVIQPRGVLKSLMLLLLWLGIALVITFVTLLVYNMSRS